MDDMTTIGKQANDAKKEYADKAPKSEISEQMSMLGYSITQLFDMIYALEDRLKPVINTYKGDEPPVVTEEDIPPVSALRFQIINHTESINNATRKLREILETLEV